MKILKLPSAQDVVMGLYQAHSQSRLVRRLDEGVDIALQVWGLPSREKLPAGWLPIVIVLVLLLIITGKHRLLINALKRQAAQKSTRARHTARPAGSRSNRTPVAPAAECETAEPNLAEQPEPVQTEPAPAEWAPAKWATPRPIPTYPPARATAIAAARGGTPPPHHRSFRKAAFQATPKHAQVVTIS